MIDPSFHVVQLPGPVEAAGHACGKACAHLFESARLDLYLDAMLRLKRSTREAIAVHAEAWARRLPEHHQRQIEAMAEGAGTSAATVRQFLYADIAPPAEARGDDPRSLVSGTPIATGDWSGFSVLQRGQTTTWTVGGSAVMDLTGDLYAPNAALSASGTALLRAQTGVLGSLRAADDASVRFDDRIESLDLPTVPGRARLVR